MIAVYYWGQDMRAKSGLIAAASALIAISPFLTVRCGVPAAGPSRFGESGPATFPLASESAGSAALILRLQDKDATVRIGTARSLAKLRAVEALGPLIHLAARDNEPSVRDAAAEAVTWLGEDPESGAEVAVREKLLQRLRWLDMDKAEAANVIEFLRDVVGTNINVDWRYFQDRGIGHTTEVTLHGEGRTVAELACRFVTGLDEGAGFIISSGAMTFSSIPRLETHVRDFRARGAYRESLKQWAMKEPAGKETFKRLQVDMVPGTRFEFEASVEDAIKTLGDGAGVEVRVDWDALRARGVTRETAVDALYVGSVEQRLWDLVQSLGQADPGLNTAGGGSGAATKPRLVITRCSPNVGVFETTRKSAIEYVVVGRVVQVTTHERVQQIMRSASHPAAHQDATRPAR
jgi:hypothetical protein